MIRLARKNGGDHGLADRAAYVPGDGSRLPFDDASFDAAFSNGSLHEWADPASTLREMLRVLKPGGRLFVSDMRRDMSFPIRLFLEASVKPRRIRTGFLSSLRASYTAGELRKIAHGAGISSAEVRTGPFGLTLTAVR